MVKVSDLVSDIIRRTPFVAEALAEGLINTSALARAIQPDIEVELGRSIKEGSIVMAINRLDMRGLAYERKQLITFFQKLRDLLVRTRLTDYTFRQSSTLAASFGELINEIGNRADVFCTFSQGVAESTIIVTDTAADELELIFAKEKVLVKETNLAAITLLLPSENKVLYGVYYFILKELAWQGINVVEVVSTSNEFTIIVKEEDLDITFSAVSKLKGK